MKYYILGRANHSPTKTEDICHDYYLEGYWELGYEIGASRNLLIKRLMNGEIKNDSETTIVTLKDRMFLYQTLFDNVISYEDFIKMDQTNLEIITELSTYEYVVSVHDNWAIDFSNKDLLENLINIQKDIVNILDKKFYVIHYRERLWGDHRNVSLEVYNAIIDKILELGHDFVVYGKNSDVIGEKYGKTECTLSQACNYMSNQNCLGMIGPLSGGSMIALLCCKSKHHILDFAGGNGDTSTIYHGTAANYIGGQVINHRTLEEVLSALS